MEKVTLIKTGWKQIDIERKAKLERLIKGGIRKCKGHKNEFTLKSMFDDETVEGRLFEEQCPYCGGSRK